MANAEFLPQLDREAVPQHHTPVAKEYPVCFQCLFSKYSVRGDSITVIIQGVQIVLLLRLTLKVFEAGQGIIDKGSSTLNSWDQGYGREVIESRLQYYFNVFSRLDISGPITPKFAHQLIVRH